MNISPTSSAKPKYPALAALAVATALSTTSCKQPLPQPTAGVPLPLPTRQQDKQVNPERDKQCLPGSVRVTR